MSKDYPDIGTYECPTAPTEIDMIFPVGCIKITDGTDPTSMYPNTSWTKISEGKMIVGAGGSIAPNYKDEGGTENNTLTSATHLPEHTHEMTNFVCSGGHTHWATTGGATDFEHYHNFSAFVGTLAGAGPYAVGSGGPPIQGGHITPVNWISSIVHNHIIYISSENEEPAPGHTHTTLDDSSGSIEPVGNNDDYNNMPPYLVLTIWERTG